MLNFVVVAFSRTVNIFKCTVDVIKTSSIKFVKNVFFTHSTT